MTNGRSVQNTQQEQRRCAQCWKPRAWPSEFIGRRGRPVQRCQRCQSVYYDWEKKTAAEKDALRPKRTGLLTGGDTRAIFALRSGNSKTGKMPTVIVSADTCPTTCAFYGRGCYAEFGLLRWHWSNAQRDGVSWEELCASVRKLPADSIWRYAVAGDLPGRGVSVDWDKLDLLLRSGEGRRGFTFTHKPVLEASASLCAGNAEAVRVCNERGFTVSLSADCLSGADQLSELGIAPVVTVLPWNAPKVGNKTPAGRKVLVCSYETRGLTCRRCGICAQPRRDFIVGFRAHGQMREQVSRTAEGRGMSS